MKDPNTKSGERRSATSLMAAAVSKAWAHQQLLEAHTAQLTQLQELLSRPQNAGDIHKSPLSILTQKECRHHGCCKDSNSMQKTALWIIMQEACIIRC
jgi:hypothetical protein